MTEDKEHQVLTAKYMSIAVFRSDYVIPMTIVDAASTSVRFDSEAVRNLQLHIFEEYLHFS